jgi:hypothetical protein
MAKKNSIAIWKKVSFNSRWSCNTAKNHIWRNERKSCELHFGDWIPGFSQPSTEGPQARTTAILRSLSLMVLRYAGFEVPGAGALRIDGTGGGTIGPYNDLYSTSASTDYS